MMIPKRKLLALALMALPILTFAQENSPYSRYGIGNIVPSSNIISRGMGGISAGYSDFQSINFVNPASYSNLTYSTLDLGGEIDSRTLHSRNPVSKFTANNTLITYAMFGVPLLSGNKKALRKNISWGLTFGLRPISRINYKIESIKRIAGIDSVSTVYEGDGGVNQAFVGTGLRIKNFSIGVNAGYLFGNKNYSTKLAFLNDTIDYAKSNSSTKTHFGGVFMTAGIQYVIPLKDTGRQYGAIKIGAYGNLQQKYNATQDIVNETYAYASSGAPATLDSISTVTGKKGTIQLPATYGVGFTVEGRKWLYGIDYEATNWVNYRFYDQPDQVKNTWTVRGGVQYFPASVTSTKYWNFVKYRAGAFFGPDYITADGNLPTWGVTIGGGFPLKLKRSFFETQYSVMNVGLEYGNRGNTNNKVNENIFRVTLGFSLSDVWFRRYKYD